MQLPDKESLKERFDQYTDEQLMDILRHHKDYQEQAVEVAVEIAVKRKLIHSRQDLFSSEFNQTHALPKKLFPLLSERQSFKMLKGIIRILYLITSVPLIFGILSVAERNMLHVILWAIGTLSWVGVILLIDRKRKPILVSLLVVLFLYFHIIYFFSIRYTFSPGLADVIVCLVSVLLFFYLISYTYILLSRKKNS